MAHAYTQQHLQGLTDMEKAHLLIILAGFRNRKKDKCNWYNIQDIMAWDDGEQQMKRRWVYHAIYYLRNTGYLKQYCSTFHPDAISHGYFELDEGYIKRWEDNQLIKDSLLG